jgi:hypothetical protein
MGIQSLYFVTAAIAAHWAAAVRFFPLVRRGKVGIEFWILLSTLTPNYFGLSVDIHDGTNVYTFVLRLNTQAKTATIVTPLGNIVVATNCFNTALFNVWTPVKIVVDTDTDRYIRLMIGPDEIDISAHGLTGGGATTDRLIFCDLRLNGSAAGVGSAYVDNFILTQNEP